MAVLVALAGLGGWFYFGQTLRITQIVGKQDAPILHFALTMLDFDTGLSRYDVFMLREKGQKWKNRIQAIERMPAGSARDVASSQLIKEIFEEPKVLNLTQKGNAFDGELLVKILQAL